MSMNILAFAESTGAGPCSRNATVRTITDDETAIFDRIRQGLTLAMELIHWRISKCIITASRSASSCLERDLRCKLGNTKAAQGDTQIQPVEQKNC